jgi:hypothetical protein
MDEIWRESRARMRNAVVVAVYIAAIVIIAMSILLVKYC